MYNMNEDCAIKIAVRERPVRENFNEEDVAASVVGYHSVNPNILVVDERPFAFDVVLNPSVAQQQLFDELIKPLVGKVKQGFNCTALAYGQTGTGKSYTMGLNQNNFEGDNVGIIPRCLQELFLNDNTNKSAKYREIRASFIEIYNEKVYDLLANNCNEPIAARGYKFTGGIRKLITNIQDCYSILIQGNKNRHVRPTKMNSQSSRSHAIFSIHLRLIGEEKTVAACLNLVDLAGSEGVRRTGHQGIAMSEGVHINQGLLTIGKVLQAMTLGYKVIPYRDSVLSSVLQDSLNPNSYLTLLACISPHREDLSETLSTLRFAQNAKQLKHSPQINTILAEIKKNKVKTPYKPPNVLKDKNNGNAAAAPNDRLHTAQKSLTKGIGYHSNTFCTPSKMRKIDSNKFNQTDMIVPLKANERNQRDYRRATELRINSALHTVSNPLKFNREFLFEKNNDTLDSRSSLFSLNISTSTTFDAAAKNSESNSFSPIVRKCMNKLEEMMDHKMSEMIETLKSVHSKEMRTISSPHMETITSTNAALETPIQLFPSTLRLEVTSIVKEILDRSVASNNNDCIIAGSDGVELSHISKTTVQPNAKCKLFATSSPVFKVPEIPAAMGTEHDSFIPLEDKSNAEDLMSSFASASEQTVQKIRRSHRLSTRKLNDSLLDENAISLEPKRRSRRLASVKELNNAYRRSIRLASHAETQATTSYEGNHLDQQKSEHKSSHKSRKTVASLLNNSVIASYFKTKSDNSPKSVHKVSKMSKHKKAILDILNKGSMKELQLLPQIGQKTAYQIVVQRTLNGKFKSLIQVEKLPIWRGKAWERFAQVNMLQ